MTENDMREEFAILLETHVANPAFRADTDHLHLSVSLQS